MLIIPQTHRSPPPTAANDITQYNDKGEGTGSTEDDNISAAGMDNYGLPKVWEQATDKEIIRCKRVLVNHLTMSQCAEFVGSSLHEVQSIWSNL